MPAWKDLTRSSLACRGVGGWDLAWEGGVGPDPGCRQLVSCCRFVGWRQSSAATPGKWRGMLHPWRHGGRFGRHFGEVGAMGHGDEYRGAAQAICSGRWVGLPGRGRLGRVQGLSVAHPAPAPQSLQSLQRGCTILFLKSLLRIAPGVLSPFLQVHSTLNKLPTPCCLLKSPPLVKSVQLSFRINLKRPGSILPC